METIPAINLKKTGENIRRLRVENKITISTLQETFGFGTPQAIYKWQRGETLPTIDNMVILSELFQVRIDEILVIDHSYQFLNRIA